MKRVRTEDDDIYVTVSTLGDSQASGGGHCLLLTPVSDGGMGDYISALAGLNLQFLS